MNLPKLKGSRDFTIDNVTWIVPSIPINFNTSHHIYYTYPALKKPNSQDLEVPTAGIDPTCIIVVEADCLRSFFLTSKIDHILA